ncbi:MAG: DUF3788 family protein [Syntrophobacterales bacterium]|jgi:hypothetical protein|nr:MAG: DUF3788 family protein [Syntrophobacterales bacterium]
MDRPGLNNPDEFPDDSILARQLGPAHAAWNAFTEMLKNDHPQAVAEWRYYHDGKSWLCKVTQKQKTLLWIAAWDKYFSVAAYLNAKAEDLVRASSLAGALKDSFLQSTGKFRSIRVEVRKQADLRAVKELLAIKLKLK